MGLDTSHDCWHGAYSAFHRFRLAVAKAAGIPLPLMEGFCDVGEIRAARFLHSEEIADVLPLSWDRHRGDPIVTLLSHSDCEGSIAAVDCGPLADRLESLIPALDEQGMGAGHVERVGGYGGGARRFVAGLRKAAAAGEDVEFH